MLEKTLGIVIQNIKYNDCSRIIHVFTSKFGRVSFLVNISNKKKSNFKPAIFQNFSILEIDFIRKQKNSIQRIKEARLYYNYSTINFDIVKTTISIFLTEILYKTLKEEAENQELFNFVKDSVIALDNLESNVSWFHIVFLIKLSQLLGFEPLDNYSETLNIFDFQEGLFVAQNPAHDNIFNKSISKVFQQIINIEYTQMNEFKFDNKFKNAILNGLIKYYQIHNESIKQITSSDILKEVFK